VAVEGRGRSVTAPAEEPDDFSPYGPVKIDSGRRSRLLRLYLAPERGAFSQLIASADPGGDFPAMAQAPSRCL